MNLSGSPSYATEALFGPPSQRIDVKEFIQTTKGLLSGSRGSSTDPTPPENLDIANECSVDGIRNTVEDALSNPFKHAHILRAHEKAVQSIRAPSKKRKDADNDNGGLDEELPVRSDADAASLASSLSAISLTCWPYPPEAALFTRQPKNSDLNVLRTIKKAGQTPDVLSSQQRSDDRQDSAKARRHHNSAASSSAAPVHIHRSAPETGAEQGGNEEQEAVVIVSVYTRLSWNTQLARLSQHAVLSSQTLGDLYDIIPCSANEIPPEGRTKGAFSTLSNNNTYADGISAESDADADNELSSGQQGAVMCVENVAYGDGQSEEDYSDKLLKHLAEASTEKNPGPELTKGPPMHSVCFRDLSLRINAPYWLLHQGSCEHFLVVDCIRLLHPSDPQPLTTVSIPSASDIQKLEGSIACEEGQGAGTGYPYPLTLHISPPILELCQACSRVPATLAVTGDIRLGQSPFKICGPCWRCLGEPTEEEREGRNVVAAPLVKHEHGW